MGTEAVTGSTGGVAAQPAGGGRMAWVDHLRTFVIFLVVNMHACVTYSHVGGWYVMEGEDPPLLAKVPFILWQGHLQAFFMGLLFFLSGVFAQRSLARRGTGPFVRERLFRLGLPALLFMAVIHPFVVAVLMLGMRDHNWGAALPYLASYYPSWRFPSGNGPLWFALALLLFSLAYAGAPSGGAGGRRPAPGGAALGAFGLALAAASFLVRTVQPVGTNILNFQLCFFAQYMAAFCAGIAAARGGWLEQLAASSRARIAGWLGLVVGPLVLLAVMVLGGPPQKIGDVAYPYAGGWYWQAFALATWEQLAGLGLGLGALAWFRSAFSRETAFRRWLSDRSFGVYVLHTPVLVAVTPLLRPLHAGLYGSVALLTVLGLILSYAAADLAKRTPGLRAIL